jgi:hypothetical protein
MIAESLRSVSQKMSGLTINVVNLGWIIAMDFEKQQNLKEAALHRMRECSEDGEEPDGAQGIQKILIVFSSIGVNWLAEIRGKIYCRTDRSDYHQNLDPVNRCLQWEKGLKRKFRLLRMLVMYGISMIKAGCHRKSGGSGMRSRKGKLKQEKSFMCYRS